MPPASNKKQRLDNTDPSLANTKKSRRLSPSSHHLQAAFLRSYQSSGANPTPLPPLPSYLTSIPKHPHNIHPHGNQIFSTAGASNPRASIGAFSKLMDSHFFDVLTYLSSFELTKLSSTCYYFVTYVRCDVRLFKDLLVRDFEAFKFHEKGEYWMHYVKSLGKEVVEAFEGREAGGVFSDVLYRSFLGYQCLPPPVEKEGGVERRNFKEVRAEARDTDTRLEDLTINLASQLGYDNFVIEYERKNKPVILTGVKGLPCLERWRNLKYLTENYGKAKFRCTSVQSTESMQIDFSSYFSYCSGTKEESPMYLFERGFTDYGLGDDYVEQLRDVMPWFVKGEDKLIDGKVHRPDLFHLLDDLRYDT